MSPFSIRILSAGSCLPAFLLQLALLLAVGLLVLGVFAAAAAPPTVPAPHPLGRRAWRPLGRIFFGVPRAWPCYCFVPVHVPWFFFAVSFPLPVPFPPGGPAAAEQRVPCRRYPARRALLPWAVRLTLFFSY